MSNAGLVERFGGSRLLLSASTGSIERVGAHEQGALCTGKRSAKPGGVVVVGTTNVDAFGGKRSERFGLPRGGNQPGATSFEQERKHALAEMTRSTGDEQRGNGHGIEPPSESTQDATGPALEQWGDIVYLWCVDAPIDLNLVRAFVAVRKAGSFSAAGERLAVPRSTVSRAVASLEEHLGVRLFHRTTRAVSITTAGVALFDRVAPSLATLEHSFSTLPEQELEPSGLLRVTSTVDLATSLLSEAVTRFTGRYRAARVEVVLTNRVVNLVGEGVDLALRILAKSPRDSTLVAHKVGAMELRLYASPMYVARRGSPRSRDDLASHDWVGIRTGEATVLRGPSGRLKLEGNTRVACDDMSFNREVLRAGAGIGLLPSFYAEADVAAGTLVRVLPRWVAFRGNAYLVQPSHKHVPRKVIAFREILVELLRRSPLVPSTT
jgi:DNA-binding transcriptional LysR family regulator